MKTKINLRWLIKVILISVAASTVFTLASTEVLGRAGYIISFSILALFILVGLVFDVVGVAVMAASEAPFHSMAAKRQKGAAESIRLVKNADKVSSYCNDVVGDVTGIISGTTAGLIAARLMDSFSSESLLFPLIISGAVTGVTVGSKAIGKNAAINNSTTIVLQVGKLIGFLKLKPKHNSKSK